MAKPHKLHRLGLSPGFAESHSTERYFPDSRDEPTIICLGDEIPCRNQREKKNRGQKAMLSLELQY